jgi:DNA-binding MarR family transcriptional regulator
MNIAKVLTDNDLSNIEKIVLMYLYDINKGNSVTLSSKYIANEIGMTRATIIKAIKGLIDKGIVVKNNNSNMYDGVTANTYNLKVRKYI